MLCKTQDIETENLIYIIASLHNAGLNKMKEVCNYCSHLTYNVLQWFPIPKLGLLATFHTTHNFVIRLLSKTAALGDTEKQNRWQKDRYILLQIPPLNGRESSQTTELHDEHIIFMFLEWRMAHKLDSRFAKTKIRNKNNKPKHHVTQCIQP